jgi:hypothetical protein
MKTKEPTSVKEHLAIIDTKLDALVDTMKEHVKSSDDFRTKVTEHTECIEWLKKSNGGIIGFIIAIIVSLLAIVFTK